MFGWWTAARRKRILRTPEPANLRDTLHDSVWQWSYLPEAIADQATNWVRIFMAEKNWEGSKGFKLQEEHKIVIAGQAALTTLAYPEWYFPGTQTILLYPTAFVAETVTPLGSGQVGLRGKSPRLGQTSYGGPVVLSWRDVYAAGQGPNYARNLTVHELAHQMDFDNGPSSDGVPPLPPGVDAERWQRDFEAQLVHMQSEVQQGGEVLIDDYGLSSLGEFFAVSSEAYFQIPHELGSYHPELFELLLAFYQRDWRRWLPRWS